MPTIKVASFNLAVDRSRPLAGLVRDGLYTETNPNVTNKNFPVEPGETNLRASLVHIGQAATTDEAVYQLSLLGLRPATVAELLTFRVQHPLYRNESPIVALGSRLSDPDVYYYASLLLGWKRRALVLDHWRDHYKWDAHCYFLAVRNL